MTARFVLVGKDPDRRAALSGALWKLRAAAVETVEEPLQVLPLLREAGAVSIVVMSGTRQLALRRLMGELQHRAPGAKVFLVVSEASEEPPPGVIPIREVLLAEELADQLWLASGQQLPRFELYAKLRRFWVWESGWALDRERGQTVLLAHAAREGEDAEVRQRLLTDARRAQLLQHRNLPRVVEVGEAEGRAFQAWEELPGALLLERLDPRDEEPPPPLSVQACVWVAAEVAQALAAIHRAGLIHGLVDPFSVWVTPEGGVRLLYLGFGQVAAESRRWTRKSNSPTLESIADLAPEELGAQGPRQDARTDVYRLGLLLYEMLWGQQPFFHRKDRLAKMRAILEQPPRPPLAERPEVPEALVGLVLRMLEKDPNRRPVDGAQAQASLELFLPRAAPRQAPAELVEWIQEFLQSPE